MNTYHIIKEIKEAEQVKITPKEVAKYIIDSPALMYEDGEYYAHWSKEKGLNYDGNMNPENITVMTVCDYADEMSREEFDEKESLADCDFMQICEELADKRNEEIDDL